MLEDRVTPATFSAVAGVLNLDLNKAGEAVTVVAGATSYTFSLNGTNTWSGPAVSGVTGVTNGVLTVAKDAFTAINLTDSAAGTAVAFANSGANSYSDPFTVTLDSGSAGIVFAGASSFGANDLSVTTDRNIFVNPGANVSTENGNLTLSANQQATPTAGNFRGVEIQSPVTATGTGNVTVLGTGGASLGDGNNGILVSESTGRIASAGGNVLVIGKGGGTGTSSTNYGISIQNGAQVTAGGKGNVTVTGVGGASTGGANPGIYLSDVGSKIASVDGKVEVSGTGGVGATGGTNIGLYLQNEALITSTGTGTVSVTGTAGTGSGGNNPGVLFTGTSPKVTSSGGSISVTATGNTSSNPGAALRFDSAGSTIASGGNAPITITADSMSFVTGPTIDSGTGTTTLRTRTAGTRINLGGADVLNGGTLTLGLTDAELDLITAGTLQIGDSNSGAITISAALDPTTVSTMLLTTGANVVDGNATGTDITVANLGITAVTGVAASANPLETSLSQFEARTGTGGVFIANTGNLNLGGVTAGISGVQVTTSGDIDLSSAGSIQTNSEPSERASTPVGNISVRATGTGANITTRNNSSGDNFIARNGNLTLDAAQDILLGVSGLAGDIEAKGNITLVAGRNIILDENTFVDATGSGTVTATAGGNITLQRTNFAGSRITTAGSAISLTMGAGGTFTANAGTNPAVNSGGGNVTITADDVALEQAVTAGSGTVTLRPASTGLAINLGINTAGQLGITQAELNQISAGTIAIGRNDIATGTVTVWANVGVTGGTNLSVTTARNVVVNGGATLSTVNGDLTLSANQQATPTTGNFRGVNVSGTVQTQGGTLTVQGRGGTDSGGQQFGVLVNGGTVQATVAGTVAVTGRGGDGGGVFNAGVALAFGGRLVGGTAGLNTVDGTGGATGTTQLDGVFVQDSTSDITTNGGDLRVTGTGGGSGASISNRGVVVAGGATVTAGGTGTVTVVGTAGSGSGGGHIGVSVNNANSRITSGGGAVSVTGFGSTGVALLPGGGITSGNNAAVTITTDNLSVDTGATPGTLSAGTGTITIRPSTTGTWIDLGGADVFNGGTLILGLTDAELDRITAGTLTIGDATNTGGIAVSAAVSPTVSSVVLITDGLLYSLASGLLTAPSLSATAKTGIGTSADPFSFNATTLTTDSSGGNANQFLKESDTVTIGAGDLNAGNGIVRLIGGTFQSAAGGDIPGPVMVKAGATLAPGGSGIDTLNTGAVSFEDGSTFKIQVNGTTAGTFDQLVSSGLVSLNGATLDAGGTANAPPAAPIVIIERATADATTFAGLPEGARVVINGVNFYITYAGGDGNDVALSNNSAPTDITAGNLFVDENSANGTAVGTVTGVDPDTTAPFNTLTYSLTETAGGRFAINSTTGEITVTDGSLLDRETNASHTIRVKVTDGSTPGLSFEKEFTVAVTNANEAPTDLSISGSTLLPNAGANAVVGTFSTTDPDVGDAFTYEFATGPGDANNSLFNIDGARLQANASVNYGSTASFTVRIKTTDQGGLSTEKTFTITNPTTVRHGSTPTTINLNAAAADADSPFFLVTLLDPLVAIKQQFGFNAASEDARFFNFTGQNEKYLLSGNGSNPAGSNYFMLKPDGKLYAYIPAVPAGTFVADLGVSVYENPALLLANTGAPLATVANPLYDLRVKLGFNPVSEQGRFFNSAGQNEKYLLGGNGSNPAGKNLFVLTAANTLLAYSGTPGSGTLVADFTALGLGDVYRNPERLTEAALGTTVGVSAFATATPGPTPGGTVTLTPLPAFDRSVTVNVQPLNAAATSRSFVYTVANEVPTIPAIPDQTGGHTTLLNIPLTVNDGDPDAATRTFAVEFSNPLHDVKTQFGLDTPFGFFNYQGAREKYVRSSNNSNPGAGQNYFAILPDNKLYRWNGGAQGAAFTGTFVLDLAPFGNVYANPALLTAAGKAPPVANVNRGTYYDLKAQFGLTPAPGLFNFNGAKEHYFLSVNGSNAGAGAGYYFITPDGKLSAWDGISTATSPVVATPGVEAYLSPGLITGAMPSSVNDTLFALKTQYGLNTRDAFFNASQGGFEKYLDNGTGTYRYFLRPNGDLFARTGPQPNAGTLIANVGAAVYANPALLYASTGQAAAATGSVAGNTLTLTPNAAFVGTVRVTVKVSDGARSSTQSFLYTATNAPPAQTPIPPVAVASFPASGFREIDLSASITDADPLTFTATVTDPLVDLRSLFGLDTFVPQFTGFNGGTAVQEKYVLSRNGSNPGASGWFFIRQDGSLWALGAGGGAAGYAASVKVGDVGAAVYADPTLLTTATVPASLASIVPTLTGSVLRIAWPANYRGAFNVNVAAFDGASEARQSFLFRVT
jgi:hypothetical protein